ncbi:hypothetical protein P8C59_003518 [Phyllachora maydis]|uniref:Uncharacterized protein n=1 Tax=Phyllachora maydis TaxID=1825666 RepID=A0AAD9I0E0_9PEZI|nr:hypothetical protein P8C59_003518 [Phyllachora maydis]
MFDCVDAGLRSRLRQYYRSELTPGVCAYRLVQGVLASSDVFVGVPRGFRPPDFCLGRLEPLHPPLRSLVLCAMCLASLRDHGVVWAQARSVVEEDEADQGESAAVERAKGFRLVVTEPEVDSGSSSFATLVDPSPFFQ